MTDVYDQASDREQFKRDLAIAAARKHHPQTTPHATGECAWCGDPAEPAEPFCGTECAQEWQEHNARQERANRISGRGVS